MVKRRFSLFRRIRAARGLIMLGGFWSGAVLLCLVLALTSPVAGRRIAVASLRAHQIVAPESGRIAEVKVAPNQSVEAGTVLAVVEVPGLVQQIAAAEGELRALEAQLAAEEADIDRKFATDLEDARRRWLSARVDLERARAASLDADQEYARMTTPGVAVSNADIERARLRREASLAEVAARESEVAALDSGYASARKRAGSTDTQALRAAVEAAAVALEALRIQADANVLRAHVSGVVTARTAMQGRDGEFEPTDEVFPAPGQWVQAGVPVLAVTEPTTTDAVLYVEIGHAQRLLPGTPVIARTAAGEKVDATVRAVGAAVEPVPMRQLTDIAVPEWGVPITLDFGDRPLVPGEALSVNL
ncbi:MAG: HlyD family secretion protein [Myxococcota bacterium]